MTDFLSGDRDSGACAAVVRWNRVAIQLADRQLVLRSTCPLNCDFVLSSLTRPPSFYRIARGMPVCAFDLQLDVPAREKASVIRLLEEAERQAMAYLGISQAVN